MKAGQVIARPYGQLRQLLLQAVCEKDCTNAELAALTGESARSIGRTMWDLEKAGLATNRKPGRQRAAYAGTAAGKAWIKQRV